MSSSASRKLKTALLTSIFAASTLMATANANIIERDEYGFEADKVCLDDDIIREVDIEKPKAQLLDRAQNAEWDMELYANKETGYWALLGKSRDPAAYPGETCVLSEGKASPYKNEKWYALFFEKNTKPKEKLAQQPATKPNLN